jgi:two-component system sensor histidine kinase PrrB
MSTDLAVLQAHPDLPEADRADVVASLVRGERRLRETLQALEQLARGELVSADQLAPVDLVDLALQAADDARRHHRSGPAVTVEVDVPDRAVVVVGWAAGLRLALDNLVTNAVRHGVAGRPGVLVRVAVRPSPTGGAELTVEDDGPGVPDDERSRVLGRFVRGRSAAGTGSGLGLALVDQQVRLHGGRLTLTASPLGGLAVRVDLPSGEKPAPAAT